MGKAVILESDTRVLDSFKMLLSSVKKHDFFYTNQAMEAIEYAIKNRVDVIVCSIDSRATVDLQFIDYISYVIPNIICIYVSDCFDVRFTIDCLNRKKPFAFITKPIAHSEELVKPIEKAILESERFKQLDVSDEYMEEELTHLTDDLKRMQFLLQNDDAFFSRLYRIIRCYSQYNSSCSSVPENVSFNANGVLDYFKACYDNYLTYHVIENNIFKDFSSVKHIYNKPDYKCFFSIFTLKDISSTSVGYKELLLCLSWLGLFISSCLMEYDVSFHIVELSDSYVIDEKLNLVDENNKEKKILYRFLDLDIVEAYAKVTRAFLSTISRVDKFFCAQNPFDSVIKIEKRSYNDGKN